jgi:hypothetical protein
VFFYNGPASLAHAPVKVDGRERHRMRQLFSLPVSAGYHVIGTNEHKRDATVEFTCGQSQYFRLIGDVKWFKIDFRFQPVPADVARGEMNGLSFDK